MDLSACKEVQERMIRRCVRVDGRPLHVPDFKAFNISVGTTITVLKTVGVHDGFNYVVGPTEGDTNVNRQVAQMMATGRYQTEKMGVMLATATKDMHGEVLVSVKKRVREDVQASLLHQNAKTADRMRLAGVPDDWVAMLCPSTPQMSDDVPSMSGMHLDE